ncbi:M23 family metallopeptidase [Puia sp. P3]|uniref:M23 family metallopeptidase n=1 Tax=Puia sp. P3 TaxID=3423952 RepID=UPI003D66CE3B
MRNFFAALCLLSSLSSSLQSFSQSSALRQPPLTPATSTPGSLFPAVSYPVDYFRDPLAVPISLAANFGELRPNHYHMGLDIRTQHRENLPVFAAADGYVARVQIEPAGFGLAIYIRHPNGYTTVYGHLNQFFPGLAEYVSQQQYKQRSWQVDLDIPSSMFPVKKGAFIAYSGNTGGSQGPHLHFEIRRTAGDVNQNPLLFGLPVPDNVPPVFARLAWYDRNLGIYEQSPHILPVRKAAAARRGKLPAPTSVPPLRSGGSAPSSTSPSPKSWISTLINFVENEGREGNGCLDNFSFFADSRDEPHLLFHLRLGRTERLGQSQWHLRSGTLRRRRARHRFSHEQYQL